MISFKQDAIVCTRLFVCSEWFEMSESACMLYEGQERRERARERGRKKEIEREREREREREPERDSRCARNTLRVRKRQLDSAFG